MSRGGEVSSRSLGEERKGSRLAREEVFFFFLRGEKGRGRKKRKGKKLGNERKKRKRKIRPLTYLPPIENTFHPGWPRDHHESTARLHARSTSMRWSQLRSWTGKREATARPENRTRRPPSATRRRPPPPSLAAAALQQCAGLRASSAGGTRGSRPRSTLPAARRAPGDAASGRRHSAATGRSGRTAPSRHEKSSASVSPGENHARSLSSLRTALPA